jgi:signal transduction histidine kinase
MKKRNVKVFFKLMVMVVFLSMPLIYSAQRGEEPESCLRKATTPSEKLKCLSGLLAYYMEEAPQKAREYGNQALRILEVVPNNNIKIKVLLGICGASCGLGEYREALAMGREAETLAHKIGGKSELNTVYIFLANIFLNLDNSQDVLSYAYKIKTISEELQDEFGIVTAHYFIARVDHSLKEYEKALSNYKKALEISKKLKIKTYIAKILGSMAQVYFDLNQYQKALDLYSRELKIMKNIGKEGEIARIMHNIARVYSKTGKYTQALQHDLQALSHFKKIGVKGRIAHVFGSIGQDYRNLNDYEKAFDYLDKSLKMSVEMGIKETEKLLYKEYTLIYKAMADYKNALIYHEKFKEISDEILSKDRNKRIAFLKVAHEVEKKEKKNQLLKKNNQIQKMELYLLAMASVLILIIALVTYNRYRTRKKAEQVLRASEQKLKKMNAAKDKLFTIIAHDLGSPLNSLLLSALHLENHFQSLGEEELEEFINNIYKQTRDMSDLLENLLQWAMVQIGKIKQNPEVVDLCLLTEETLEQIEYSAQKKKIHLASHIIENTFAWADKNMMKAVIRNLLSNAVKYTHLGGEVKITSTDAGNQIEITVSDNGVGIAIEKAESLFTEEIHESTRGTANEKGTGLGLMLCKEFVEKNGGKIRVQSQPDRGSHFSFTLPKQN